MLSPTGDLDDSMRFSERGNPNGKWHSGCACDGGSCATEAQSTMGVGASGVDVSESGYHKSTPRTLACCDAGELGGWDITHEAQRACGDTVTVLSLERCVLL